MLVCDKSNVFFFVFVSICYWQMYKQNKLKQAKCPEKRGHTGRKKGTFPLYR